MATFYFHGFLLLMAACLAVGVSPVVPNPGHKARVADRPLSDKKHFEEEGHDGHNMEFDHDAFLGKYEAKEFDELTPEESKARLRLLYAKIDQSGDHKMSEEELTKWMQLVQAKTMLDETNNRWAEVGPANDNAMTWDEYSGRQIKNEEEQDELVSKTDKNRWDAADVDKNFVLSRSEFNDFVHPEKAPHMRDVVLKETMDDIDEDHDGLISLKEFMHDAGDDEDDESADEEEKSWVQEEEEEFRTELDKNHDGFLDSEEVYQWIVPNDYEHIDEETKHLFSEADSDNDGFLSMDEVVDNYELFVGSEATNYGDMLKSHVEL